VEQCPVPSGYYASTEEWIREFHGQGAKQEYYKDIYLEVPGPNGLKRGPTPWIPPWYPSGFVAMIPGGRVLGRNGTIITPDNRLLFDLSFERVETPDAHPVFQRGTLPPVESTTETVAVLTHVGSSGYYEWMYVVLSRLDLLNRSGVSIDRYVFNHSALPFQLESLACLGLSEKVINSHDMFHLEAKRLVVPSVPCYTAKWACDFLRTELLVRRNIPGLDEELKIYIDRSKAPRRRVLNEAEIKPILDDYGFRAVALESMTLEEQIQLFFSAQAVVAPHGAGLTNITSCRPATKVIEFFSPNWIDPCYWWISEFLNLDYHHFMGKGVRPEEFKDDNPYWAGADDILVDPGKLVQCIRSAGISKMS